MSASSPASVDVQKLAVFLAPLAKFAARHSELDALVFWANPDWDAEPTEDLDADEAAYYLEGLAGEGFCLEWRVLALASEDLADHIRLYIYEGDVVPPAIDAQWNILMQGKWPL